MECLIKTLKLIFFGNKKNSLRTIGKFLVPNQDELKDNSRSRSAKLRIAEKI